jgi:hypothetical protein
MRLLDYNDRNSTIAMEAHTGSETSAILHQLFERTALSVGAGYLIRS